MKSELHKANDLIRRLSEENEYHLRQVERLVRKLEIYKQSARGSSAVRKAERKMKEIESERDEEINDLRARLDEKENLIMGLQKEERTSRLDEFKQSRLDLSASIE